MRLVYGPPTLGCVLGYNSKARGRYERRRYVRIIVDCQSETNLVHCHNHNRGKYFLHSIPGIPRLHLP